MLCSSLNNHPSVRGHVPRLQTKTGSLSGGDSGNNRQFVEDPVCLPANSDVSTMNAHAWLIWIT